MENIFDEVRNAVLQARLTQKAADENTLAMAKLISGRLRNIELNYWSGEVLAGLKKELRDFNSVTKKWKD